eukprot:CAMPEP_0182459652 /NCGR_PEP_ID=MMETSP1319-20130603/4734_1 /TAXON_ID=172717 /ORGANISM="Bolidomonas pacifica, Strain RCC208" /LENGTH=118 /DNA_ID=CAMNT_0024658615 /DNA_START=13 /DNA_END=366 /DNA_ORIENTATION=+
MTHLLLLLSLLLLLLLPPPSLSASDSSSSPPPPSPSSAVYSVCSSSNPDLLGRYSHTHYVDSAPVWTNDEGMGIWRHFGYWYVGDYSEWPPVTYYRCVVGCEQGGDEPPLKGYKTKKG